MSRHFQWFYDSKPWRIARNNYFDNQLGICERCGRPADYVHHKIYINAKNINDPNIALSFDNLECLCGSCHTKEHQGASATTDGLKFNSEGELIYEDSIIHRE